MSNFIKQRRIFQVLGLGLVVFGLFVNFKNDKNDVVNIYGWYGIFPHEVMEEFEKETGIKVVYDSFDNNNILESKLLSGSSGYDLVFPSFIPDMQISAPPRDGNRLVIRLRCVIVIAVEHDKISRQSDAPHC